MYHQTLIISLGLTCQSLRQLILPEEASRHHQRQNKEEHHTQLAPLHLHLAGFRESFKFNRSSRSSLSRGWLMYRHAQRHATTHSEKTLNVYSFDLAASFLHVLLARFPPCCFQLWNKSDISVTLFCKTVIPAALNGTHHLMLHRPERDYQWHRNLLITPSTSWTVTQY